jgi:hypothetical protein
MLRTRVAAVLIAFCGVLAAVLVVGMPHADRGNLFGATLVGLGLAVLAGGGSGALLGGTSTVLAALFVVPLLLWDLFALGSVVRAGLEVTAWALWLAQTAGLAAAFFGAGLVGARLRGAQAPPPGP